MKIKRISAILLTAAMLLSFAACSGASGKVTAQLSEIFEDGGLKSYYLNNPETFMAAAQEEIKMSESDAQSFLASPDKWQVYSLDITVSNKADEAYSFIGFEEIDTETQGLYFSICPINGELSLPSGTENEPYPATVVIDREKVSLDQMYSAVASFDIVLLSYPTPEDDDEVIDPSDYIKVKVENKITAPEKDDTDEEDEILAKRSSITDASAYLKLYRSNELIFANEAKLYGMDGDTAAAALDENGNWQCYTLTLNIENKTDDDLTIYRILPENNGAKGVWVNGISQNGEFSMPGGAKEELPVTILVNPDELGGKSIEQALSEMVINLEYSKGTLMDEHGNESIQIKKIATVK